MALPSSETILLQPRQYAQHPGKLLLLPLLPVPKPTRPLPIEIWSEIFIFAAASSGRDVTTWSFSYLTICKSLKVFFSRISLLNSLNSLNNHIVSLHRTLLYQSFTPKSTFGPLTILRTFTTASSLPNRNGTLSGGYHIQPPDAGSKKSTCRI